MDDLDTLGADEQVDDLDQDTPDDDSQQQDDEPFLAVDDRTTYKTREDAIKGIRNAGQRIASLSGYEKIAKQYSLSDPSQLIPLLNAGLAASKKQDGNAAQKTDGDSDVFSDPNLTPREKQALKWLQKSAAQLGYVPKTELVAMQEQLKKLEERFETTSKTSEEKELQTRVNEGKNYLRSFMTEAKLNVKDAKLVKFVEAAIVDFIESDEANLERFNAGGETLKTLVKEAFDDVSIR
jgi:hypothetical protein